MTSNNHINVIKVFFFKLWIFYRIKQIRSFDKLIKNNYMNITENKDIQFILKNI